MEKLNETLQRINAAAEKRTAEAEASKKKLAEQIKEDAQKLAALTEQTETATREGNETEYNKLYKASEKVRQSMGMKKQRLEMLESQPLLTAEEYANAAGEIRAEYDVQETEAKKAIAEHLQAMAEISNGLFKAGQEANSTISQLARLANRDNSIADSIWSVLPEHVRDALKPLAVNLHIDVEIDPPRLLF